jgi:hypothetical protein
MQANIVGKNGRTAELKTVNFSLSKTHLPVNLSVMPVSHTTVANPVRLLCLAVTRLSAQRASQVELCHVECQQMFERLSVVF